MKKILLFSGIFCFALIAVAQKPRDTLPEKITKFIDLHFPNSRVVKVEVDYDDNEYEVELNNGFDLKFDLLGEWSEIDADYVPLPKSIIDLLPQPLLTYIANKYPRRAIVQIEQTSKGYEVELSNSVELVFDRHGDFIRKD